MSVNFTPRCQEIIAVAKKLATKFNNSHILLDHFLVAFIKIDSILIPFIESKLNIDFEGLEGLAYNTIKKESSSQRDEDPIFSLPCQSCLDFASELAQQKKHSYVSVEHLFYALLNDGSSHLIDYFFELNIDVFEVQELLDEILAHDIIYNPVIDDSFGSQDSISSSSQNIESYSVDYNDLARSGEFDFITANPEYTRAIEETLCRKTKRSALLVGDAGVGKTALVENLARKIVNLSSNDYLINKKIISLDLSSMVAGTKFRGQFEERLKAFIDFAKKDKNIILFIDEIHTLIGAGNTEGGLDAANILKPYIARGEITCIGATTFEEYKKSFDKDPALKRRFNIITIDEPSAEESINILKNVAESYEIFHSVKYKEEALIEAVRLSEKYITSKKLPDKAVDIIDQAGAKVKIKSYKKPPIAKNMEKILVKDDVEIDVKSDVFEKYKNIINEWSKRKAIPSVSVADIQKIISENFNIPIETVKQKASNKLLTLESKINRQVIGQKEAIEKIVNALFKTHCGLNDENRPLGSFLFLGKTGTGKTLTAKSLAQNYFGTKNSLIYFDMSEFSESVSVNKFSGSSPGYVGYEKGGILTEKIKRNSHCVLLFDEIEKAHPTVLQSLLQILEEGRMTDNFGDEVSFKNTIIILTSNLAADLIDKNGSVGFMSSSEDKDNNVFNHVKKSLSPELFNRFDGIVVFNNFQDKDFLRIINIELKKVQSKLKNIKVNFKPKVKNAILNLVKKENLGGRPIRKIIQNEIEVAIAKYIIYNSDCDSVSIDYINNNFCCNVSSRKKKQS